MKVLFWLLVSLLLGYFAGWRVAHKVVASECKRLGGFYVDSETFKCVAVEQIAAAAKVDFQYADGRVSVEDAGKEMERIFRDGASG